MDIMTLDLFSNGKVVVLNDSFFLTDKQVKMVDDFKSDDLYQMIEQLPESVTLIFTVKAEKISAKLKIAKFVTEKAKVIPLVMPNDEQLRNQITKKITNSGNTYDDEAIDFALEMLPRDMSIIQNEITKLSLLKDHITVETIKNVLTKTLSYDVFAISNALLDHKLDNFINM
ncbi:hypothetical protein Zmor_008956 [Zophobas morio]|uniref:DNA polymerase III delta N-terminal domain-containing protein n=1 Tax=Zophobas morio TaxID=2755281 RepID=A0AA38HLZ5_9CUCU|nr:hypothetical protein Zmor_008956 [Zophobas morio]